MSKFTSSGMTHALLHTGNWKHMVSSATVRANTDADPNPPQVHLDPDDPSDASDLQLNQKKSHNIKRFKVYQRYESIQ